MDDEPNLAEMAAEFLKRSDDRISVDTVTSASEGLDQLRKNGYDCVVSDYDMPGQNGIEFLEAVREENADLPFILYTGKGSEEVASEAIAAGVSDYLQKEAGTSQYEVLANRIRNVVEQRRSKEEVAEREYRTNRQNRAFEAFLDIVNDASLSFDEQMTEVLDLGVEFLDLDIGVISNIHPPDYSVEHVVTMDGSIEPGAVLAFRDTFCSLVYETDGPVAFESPEEGDVKHHPCYQDRGLQAYLGEPLMVEGTRYGTLNFSSPDPREEPFSDSERAFVQTIAEWVTNELGRNERQQEIHRLH